MRGLVSSIPLFFLEDEKIDWMALDSYLDIVLSSNRCSCLYMMTFNTRLRFVTFEECIIQLAEFIVRKEYTLRTNKANNHCWHARMHNSRSTFAIFDYHS